MKANMLEGILSAYDRLRTANYAEEGFEYDDKLAAIIGTNAPSRRDEDLKKLSDRLLKNKQLCYVLGVAVVDYCNGKITLSNLFSRTEEPRENAKKVQKSLAIFSIVDLFERAKPLENYYPNWDFMNNKSLYENSIECVVAEKAMAAGIGTYTRDDNRDDNSIEHELLVRIGECVVKAAIGHEREKSKKASRQRLYNVPKEYNTLVREIRKIS